VLSVVVAIVSDTTRARADARLLAGCLQALADQVEPPPIEVIVPVHERVDGIAALRERFPAVAFVEIAGIAFAEGAGREHHDVLRARGLAAARGDLVALIEDHAWPDPDWSAGVVAAHRDGPAAIGGAIENGIDRPLNWAVYFCDFGRYQSPLPAGPAAFASDANVSYKRAALEAVRPVWAESFREVVVNGALTGRGEQLALSPLIVVRQHRSDLAFGPALRERFIWARSYALTRSASLGRGKRLVLALLSPALPAILLGRMARTAQQRGRHFGAFLRALPLIAALLVGWAAGEGAGYLAAATRR
jgi:Glycosyl transferase family 2